MSIFQDYLWKAAKELDELKKSAELQILAAELITETKWSVGVFSRS